ncbi:DUF364 domain-containing protein [Clostridium coskatii]|uniref:Heavy-metal chelation domain-containing protein n=1 Tax=Clostridium coskatii TaxID=1705578 RepID=A0A166SXU2_9CLOT|nr:DUF364 domain-containing protein [Clostridium coskatii]OAA92924.1 hypothetical protein WX73_00593 [Clostridium coskatii]OBR95866.1 hypothetical protein CLCOS_12990 [Clostridium coskatii]
MWEIYNDLISRIPENIRIKRCLMGVNWFLVESEGIGMAMRPLEVYGKVSIPEHIAGMKVCEIARYIKSWNNYEAALGLAAINSVINTENNVSKIYPGDLNGQPNESSFILLKEQIIGKNVTVIGHFPRVEALRRICKLSILERKPDEGDYPDPACEYILPYQDYVFITGTTIINKTIPRLLELSKNANVILVGPSVPITEMLFSYGVDLLAGTVIVEKERAWDVIQEGNPTKFFKRGARRVNISFEDYKNVQWKDEVQLSKKDI